MLFPVADPAALPTVDYAKYVALAAARRDKVNMKAVYELHKDVDGGLSKAALVAALNEVDAPVLSSSEAASEDSKAASEDSLFRRADSKLSGAVDQHQWDI